MYVTIDVRGNSRNKNNPDSTGALSIYQSTCVSAVITTKHLNRGFVSIFLIFCQILCLCLHFPRVEEGKDTSTVIPASRKRRREGNPVLSSETLMYGYESSAGHWQIALQITDPSSRQRVPVWKQVRIRPPLSLRVVRGDGKGTELVSGDTVPADLREG
jgi:hypothetical protein